MNKKVLSFDLDDTLYDEKQFVFSGYKEVSKHIAKKSEESPEVIHSLMIKIFNEEGRNGIFNNVLDKYGIKTKKEISQCLRIYRSHNPKIELYKGIEEKLNTYRDESYLITDGNRTVQQKKVRALKIENLFKKIFFTRDYGIKNEKPSIKVFKIISEIENKDLSDIIYIGDNPNKDFLNLNKFGALTIQIGNKKLNTKEEYNAKLKFKNTIKALEYLESKKILI
tara:strand:- start:2508 stop:3179 length:672 start_codon:yes stop_codon:yes gene_type:complete